MGGHARFSPSSGKRRLECPPSLLLEEQFPDEESPFAAEGSAGHAMAEYLINKYLKKRTKRPVSDYYSDELLEAVDDYVEYNITQIEQARKDCDEPFIGVELKVSLAHRINDCFGTADMVVADSHKIHIIDLKLGKGVVVDAEQNVQLMIYGLGVLDMLGFLYEIDTVELTIVQPRIEHFSTWEISAGELLAWGKDVLEPGAAKALSGEGEFKAGDHCRFCKARFTCRARAEEYLKLAQMGFTVVPFGQGYKDMSPPTKELMKLTLEERIAHGGHKVLRWMMDNVFVRQDPAGNIKMDKEKSTEKIDGAVATVMALDRAIRNEGSDGSVYDDRGILVF